MCAGFIIRMLGLGLLLGMIACDAPPTDSSITNSAAPSPPIASFGLEDFVQATQQAEAGQVIPLQFSQAHIAPALAYDSLYPFLDTSLATYQYGEVVYEDSSIVALSFYYKALDGRNLLAASFLASYERASGNCLGLRPIFSSSTFDKSQTKGYQLGLSYRSTLRYVEDGSAGILRLYSSIQHFYSAFEEGVAPRANEQFKLVHTLDEQGRFSTKRVS